MQIDKSDKFCKNCGTTMATRYVKHFARVRMNEEDFVNNINKWLWENDRLGNIKCKFDYDSSLGFFVNKFKLTGVVLEFEVFDSAIVNVYGIDIIDETSFFSHMDKDELLYEWKQNNSDTEIVSVGGGTHHRGDSFSAASGIGGTQSGKLYVFYKYRRKK